MTTENAKTSLLTVRVILIQGRAMTLKTVEKTFKTDAAMAKWIDSQEEAGKLHAVLAYC